MMDDWVGLGDFGGYWGQSQSAAIALQYSQGLQNARAVAASTGATRTTAFFPMLTPVATAAYRPELGAETSLQWLDRRVDEVRVRL